MKRKAYVAALRRAKYVIENIPNTAETMRALKVARDCYQELGYFELMDDIDAVMDANKDVLQNEEPVKNRNFFSRNAPSPALS
jgi:outer membrane protein assembly factor BamD